MDLVHSRCAGLDVHQATVVATVRVPGERVGRQVVTQTFGTMTADLLTLRDWLQAFGVTHVALESTGVYWKNHEGVPSPALDVSGSAWACVRARS